MAVEGARRRVERPSSWARGSWVVLTGNGGMFHM